MANTDYFDKTTRVHWTGADADVDAHLEAYFGEVEHGFDYSSIFRSLVPIRSTGGYTNTYRFDRLNSSVVFGRKSGELVPTQRIANDRALIVVNFSTNIRNAIDENDDWTSPDFLRELGSDNGAQMARTYDTAHVIQLIKSRKWTAPAHLNVSHFDGIEILCPYKKDAIIESDMISNAVSIVKAHNRAITKLIERDVPFDDLVCLATPAIMEEAREHPRLQNMLYTGGVSNGSYANRPIYKMNGIDLIETPRFPNAAKTDHPLGPDFNTDADDIACQMIIFSKKKSIFTVEAKPMFVDYWEDKPQCARALEVKAMYTVGQRRPDTCAVIKFVDPPTTP
jgi:hypothetical protein